MKKVLLFLMGISFGIVSASALSVEERYAEYEKALENYTFEFKYVNMDENIKLIDEVKEEWYDEERIRDGFFVGLIRNDIENLIDLTPTDAIDIIIYNKGDKYYTCLENETCTEHIAEEDIYEIAIYDMGGNASVFKQIRGSFIEVEGDFELKKEAYDIVKSIAADVYIADVDMFNHYLNYETDTSTFFSGNNALNEFASLKKVVEENPKYNFFVAYEDTRRGDNYLSMAEGSTYIEKDGIIYGFTLNTYSCNNMFFVPTDTKIEDYGKVLEERLKEYVNDENIKVEVLPYDDTLENFYQEDRGNVSYSLTKLLNITIDEYYKLANTSLEEEKKNVTNEWELEWVEENQECIMMYSYQLFINGKKYEIGIVELDLDTINKFGTILSVDNKTGIIIKTGASNVPLDASLSANEYELNDEEVNYLYKNGYKRLRSYNFELYSRILDKVISKFNDVSEILIPFDEKLDLDKIKVLYMSDDMKTIEEYEVKEVIYNDIKYLSFSTNHFSNYIVIEDTLEVPNTIDNINIYLIFGITSLFGIVSTLVLLNKKYIK